MQTNRELTLKIIHSHFSITVPKGAAVIAVPYNAGKKTPTGYALDRPQDYGANRHDAKHYYFWIPADAVSMTK